MAKFLTTTDPLEDGSALAFDQLACPMKCTLNVDARLFRNPKPPQMPFGGLSGLTPLQLAVRLGKVDVFRHLLLWHHTVKNWEWGEKRSYKIRLTEVDEPGKNSDVLNLCCRLDAEQATKEMISEGSPSDASSTQHNPAFCTCTSIRRLDPVSDYLAPNHCCPRSEFMTGFIWDLFVDKWQNYGRMSHWAITILNLSNLGCLIYLVFSMKMQTGKHLRQADRHKYLMVNICLLCLIGFQLFFEISYIMYAPAPRAALPFPSTSVSSAITISSEILLPSSVAMCGNERTSLQAGRGGSCT